MPQLTKWEDAIQMNILARKNSQKRWTGTSQNIGSFYRVLMESFSNCGETCRNINVGRIAITLSGGLDSSFSLCMLRSLFSKAVIEAITIGESNSHSDIHYAKEIARFCNIPPEHHHIYIPTKDEIEEARRTATSLWPSDNIERGGIGVFLTYQYMARIGLSAVIAHDGIDEQLGGYPQHRWVEGSYERREAAFREYWDRLANDHLLPLTRKSGYFEIVTILPYLQKKVISYINKIPINDRTNEVTSKIPLRTMATAIFKDFPQGIIERQKMGFCDALSKVNR